jgi:hypothetical protein
MNEKQYNTIGITGAGSLVIGILSVIFGLAAGTLMIINGARLLSVRENMLI